MLIKNNDKSIDEPINKLREKIEKLIKEYKDIEYLIDKDSYKHYISTLYLAFKHNIDRDDESLEKQSLKEDFEKNFDTLKEYIKILKSEKKDDLLFFLENEYGLLYSELGEEDSGKILDRFRTEFNKKYKINYILENIEIVLGEYRDYIKGNPALHHYITNLINGFELYYDMDNHTLDYDGIDDFIIDSIVKRITLYYDYIKLLESDEKFKEFLEYEYNLMENNKHNGEMDPSKIIKKYSKLKKEDIKKVTINSIEDLLKS